MAARKKKTVKPAKPKAKAVRSPKKKPVVDILDVPVVAIQPEQRAALPQLSTPPKRSSIKENVWAATALYFGIILVLPFLLDFAGRLLLALGGPSVGAFARSNIWVADVVGYLAVYLFILFYLKTTFNPLAVYGYRWNKDHLWWCVYLGIGSGVIIYFVDKMQGIDSLHVMAFTPLVFVGYLFAWAILPAVTEETLFRGVIQGFYQRRNERTVSKYAIHIGVFIAVAFELLFHLSAPLYYSLGFPNGPMNALLTTLPQLIYVLVFGTLSGIVYQRTRSLVGPIIIHALGNLTELAIIWMLH